jgi:hypothetical protein
MDFKNLAKNVQEYASNRNSQTVYMTWFYKLESFVHRHAVN